jgi:hypothetical protein
MKSAEELSAERLVYEAAVRAYVQASGALTTHAVKGTLPTERELRAERKARGVLGAARRAYLDGLDHHRA